MAKCTTKEIVDRFFRLSLLSGVIDPPAEYDGDTDAEVLLEVELLRDGVTQCATTVDELVRKIASAGVSLSEYARGEPQSLASAISYLQDRGRIVWNHPLFTDYAESQQIDPLLPYCEGEYLVWYEMPYQGGTGFVRRSFKFDG